MTINAVPFYNMDNLNILKSNPKFVWVLETEALLTLCLIINRYEIYQSYIFLDQRSVPL